MLNPFSIDFNITEKSPKMIENHENTYNRSNIIVRICKLCLIISEYSLELWAKIDFVSDCFVLLEQRSNFDSNFLSSL